MGNELGDQFLHALLLLLLVLPRWLGRTTALDLVLFLVLTHHVWTGLGTDDTD